jgi:hypothetical protein
MLALMDHACLDGGALSDVINTLCVSPDILFGRKSYSYWEFLFWDQKHILKITSVGRGQSVSPSGLSPSRWIPTVR